MRLFCLLWCVSVLKFYHTYYYFLIPRFHELLFVSVSFVVCLFSLLTLSVSRCCSVLWFFPVSFVSVDR